MRVADGNAEPSMEDILSSIKRIIAEDSDAALAGPRAKRSVGLSPMSRPEPAETTDDDDDEILELTEAADPVPEPVAETPKPIPAPVPQPIPAPVAKAKARETEPMPAAEPKPTLVSSTTAEASRSSLAALSAMIVKPDIAGADTLEGLVRDMLKPLLADWLDANLPDIVERQVAQEIARISARG